MAKRIKQKAQATLEYLIIFAALAALSISLLSSSNSFIAKIRDSAEGLFQDAAERITQ